METVKWVECCVQMERNWPRLRLPPETVEAWFDAFGKHADYATVQRTLMRLVTDDDKAPGLATIRAAYRDLDTTRRPPFRDALEDANEKQRRAVMAAEWLQIWEMMHRYPRLRDVFASLRSQYGDDPTNAQGTLVRMAMIDEIRHLTPDEIEACPETRREAEPGGDPGPVEPVDADPFTPVGDAFR